MEAALLSIMKKLVLSCSLPDSWRRPPDAEVPALIRDLEELQSSVLDLSKEDEDEDEVDSTRSSTLKMTLTSQLQELCYDAEDYLEMVQHSRGGCSWQISWIRSKATRQRPALISAKDISGLISRVEPAKEIAQAYIKSASSRTTSTKEIGPRPQKEPDCRPKQEPAESSSRRVVYSDDTLQPDSHDEQLVRLLALESDQQLKTVAIHGLPGVGKTTLARRLYHCYEGRFHCGVFLRASRNQDTTRLLATMLSKIKGQQGCRYWGGFGDEQDLIDSIRQHLQGKSYFIVIDDLWATSVWDFLSRAFPKDNCGSRIVITTRVTEVAFACCNNHTVDIFNMKPLDDNQSLQLFYSRVKHINGNNAEQCKAISHGIIRNCGHLLPLAIINIAGMLAGWPDFNMNDWEYVSKCSFRTLTANLTTEEAMERFLNLMYNNLPAKLKTCLLYLSMYPEGCVIGKDDLVRQWAAEGIFSQVEPKGREYEVGFIYFDELLKRGLIQPVDTDYNDQVLSCIVHQVVLEFITKKSIQENFITVVVDYRETGTGLHDNKVHRLSARFEGAKSAQIPRSFRVRQVRSFMFSGFVKSLPSLRKYCLLRVLILHVWRDDKGTHVVLDLSPVGHMLHVRYVKVVSDMIVKLPLIIRGLRHLETLEVGAEEVAVPLDVFSLKSLLHLRLPSKAYLPDSYNQRFDLTNTFPLRTMPYIKEFSVIGMALLSHGHQIFGHLTSLQSLGYIDLSTCPRVTVWQLGKLTNLKDLHLTCSAVRPRHRISNIECLADVLGICTNLKSLIIRGGEASSNQSISFDGLSSLSSPPVNLERFVLSPRVFKMAKLPKWIRQLSRLCTLKIAVGELSSEDVDILKGLPALTALSLYVRSNPKDESMIVFSKGFAVLKYFKFTCTALCVKFSGQVMPAVQRLNVRFNANTMQQYRPEDAGIGYLSRLKVISAVIGAAGIDQASREAAKSRLLDAILSNHPKPPPIINVQMVDWVIHGDTEECSTGVMIHKDESSRDREHTRSFLSQFPFTRRALLPSIFTRRGQDDEQQRIEENDDVQDSIILRESSSLMQKPGWVTRRASTGVGLLMAVRGSTYMIRQYIKQPGFGATNEMASINQEIRQTMGSIIASDSRNKSEWILQAQDLAYDVQDFTDIYTWRRSKSRRRALAHIGYIAQLKDRISSLREWQQRGGSSSQQESSQPSCGPCAPEDVLVGIDQPRNELLELIFEWEAVVDIAVQQKPRVVSVVGYSGIGKTALARAVYYDPCVRDAFNGVAWVVASECSHGCDLLIEIWQQVKDEQAANGAVPDCYRLKEILREKRFLIVIDDLHGAGMWNDIKGVFSETHSGSRIIVTTSIQSVAAACTPEPRYIYRMRSLGSLESEKLLWMRIGSHANRTPALEHALGNTLKKCGGLPLALISVANHLCRRKEENLTQGAAGAFEEMDRVLAKCYDSLPDNAHRMCLLSLSTFPQGHVMKRKRLIRWWVAEGLAVGDCELSAEQVAGNIFDVLIDRNVTEPVLIAGHGSSKVKACLVLGVIKDFINKTAVSKETVAIIQNDELLLPNRMAAHRPVRRLLVHGGTTKKSEAVAKAIGLDRVRSLTICNAVPFDFQGCWLLRVLDLEACQGVDKSILGNICKLVFLKYLSLRGTDVYRIPKNVKKLQCLETLDLRDTLVEELPIQVLMLPRLVHLFGKFELPRQLKHRTTRRRLQAFLSERSRLQTLSGFVMVDGSNSFEHTMITIRSLRKVKLWSKHSISPYQERHLASSLRERLVGNNALESLSVDFGNESINFLNDIGATNALVGSMKLQGRLTSLPSFMTSYDTTLSQLQLFSTGLGIEALSLLQILRRLVFLKLVQDGDGFWGDCFAVKKDGFPSLVRLCIEARELPQLHIHEGGMSTLTSLELLCPMFAESDAGLGETYVEDHSEKRSKQVDSVQKPRAVDPQISFKDPSSEISSKGTEIEEIASHKTSKEVGLSIVFKEILPGNTFRINYSEKTKRRFDLKEHFKGMEHLQCLSELVLHPSVSQEVLDAWKEQARNHINRPKVTRALSIGGGPGTAKHEKEGQHRSQLTKTRGSETASREKAEEHSSVATSREEAGFQEQTSDGTGLRPKDSLHHLAQRIQGMIYALTRKMMLHEGHVNHNYEYIRGKLKMMAAYLGDGLSRNSQLVPREQWVLQLQDLVFDIEDLVDIYNYMCTRSRIRALAHLSHTEHLKVKIESLHQQQRLEYIQRSCMSEDRALSQPCNMLIGMDVPMRELLELVHLEELDLDANNKVISIVGCPGLGKTSLAKAFYDQELIREMFTLVWVSASECSSANDLLIKVVEQASTVLPAEMREATSDDMDLLHVILAQKRLLIIIDDLREIKLSIFIQRGLGSITSMRRSLIIVTTRIQSIAAKCSPHRCIYRMPGLGHMESEELFLRTAYGDAHPTPGVADALEEISGRCDGLPLALISAAHVWREQGCAGKYVIEEEVNKALSRWYESLPDATHMLSLGIFPYGHSIKRKSLIRRWIAEGLVSAEKDGDQQVREYHNHKQLIAEQVGDERFDELVDQSIVEPVLTGSNNFKVKRCRLRRPVLDFIVRESVSKNMVTLLRGDEPLRRGGGPHPARVLSIHKTTETSRGRAATEIGFDRIRSLSIFNKGVAFDLQQCTYLRVLDLECCRGVDDSVVAGICKLSLLRYLSLRGSDVEQIPSEIEKLECLETLDIRETAVYTLPMEALMLPRLVHLFGKFELTRELRDWRKRSKLERFFREESKLQTLAGLVIVGKDSGYEDIVLHIRLLRKLKVWYQPHPSGPKSNVLELFVSSLNKLLTGNTALDSLSIDFEGSFMYRYFTHVFNSIGSSGPCMLSSIKLRGWLEGPLPEFITSPANYLSELQLSSSTVLQLQYLSTLQSLRRLLYLKLVVDNNDGKFEGDTFTVDKDGFPRLERLCIEAPKLPRLRIVEGAMPALTSLHLLCPMMSEHPRQMGEIDEPETTSETEHGMEWYGKEWRIEYLKNLNDLVLHYSVGDEEFDFWKEKARRNMNGPKVTWQPMP